MPEGTTIKLFVPDVHRSTAHADLEEAECDMRRTERLLVAMAASGGGTPLPEGGVWYEHVAREVPDLLDSYAADSLKRTAARMLVEEPEECDDDYDRLIGQVLTHDDVDADVTVEIVSNYGGAVIGRCRVSELGFRLEGTDRQLGTDFHIRKATNET